MATWTSVSSLLDLLYILPFVSITAQSLLCVLEASVPGFAHVSSLMIRTLSTLKASRLKEEYSFPPVSQSQSDVRPNMAFRGSTPHRSSAFSPDQTVELMLCRSPRRVIRISHHTLPRTREENGPSLQDQCDETMVTRFVQQACTFIETYGLGGAGLVD